METTDPFAIPASDIGTQQKKARTAANDWPPRDPRAYARNQIVAVVRATPLRRTIMIAGAVLLCGGIGLATGNEQAAAAMAAGGGLIALAFPFRW